MSISGIYDTLISKFDAHGNELWTHQFDGSSHNFPADIAVAAGGIYVVGNPAFGASISPFVRAYDASGTELWTVSLAGFFAHSIAADASGVYVFHSISGGVISKYDINGNAVWTSPVAGFTGGGGRTNSVLAVDAGGVYVGSNGSPAFVRKYTKDGAELWTRQFEMWNSSPAVASDGSTVYVGGINPPGIPGLIRTYDVDGNELSAHVLRFGEIQTGVQDFAVGCAGIFAAGYTSSSSFVLRPIDTFVMKLSSPAHPCYLDAPTVSATSPLVVVNEGQVGRNSGTYANPGTNQPVSLSASVGTLTRTGIQEGSWEWSFNTTDGPAQSQLVTITADDGQGEISTALFEVIVNNVAPSEKISGAPASSPAGTPINLTSMVTDGGGADGEAGFTYAWTVTHDGQLVASGSESSFSFTPTAGGEYQVVLQVTDKDGGTSVNTVTIAVGGTNRPPLANAGPDRTVEATSTAGAAAVLDGSASSDPDGDALTFTWTGVFGTATGQAPTVALPFGAYTITLMVGDGKGGTASDTVVVTVVDTTPPTIVCPPDINGTGGQAVVIGIPSVTDSVDPTPTVSNNAPANFPLGTTTVTWVATDANGNSGSCQQQVLLAYQFTGFFQPVDNLPVFNQVKAGQAIPVKFTLHGNQGLEIFAADYPISQGVGCNTGSGIDDIEQTVTAGSSSLSYDSSTDQYIYVWSTRKAWAGTCRQLIVRLKDGTDHQANFKFK